jgi:hypothetical protein
VFRLMNETIARFMKESYPNLDVYIDDCLYMKQIIIECREEKLFFEWMIFDWDPNRMFVRNDEEG